MTRNLEEMQTLEQPLRDLGAQHVQWGAKPEDYVIVREALIRAIRLSSRAWTDTLEARLAPRDYRYCGADAAGCRRAHGDDG